MSETFILAGQAGSPDGLDTPVTVADLTEAVTMRSELKLPSSPARASDASHDTLSSSLRADLESC